MPDTVPTPRPPERTADDRVPVDHQLAEPTEGLVGRIIGEINSLAQEATALVELRVKKAQLDLEERLDQKANDALANATFAALAALGAVFVLVALSLGLGAWLGHPAWGFLIVGIGLAVAGFAFKKTRPDVVHVGDQHVDVARKKIVPPLPESAPS